MKRYILFLLFCTFSFNTFSQEISAFPTKMNFFYKGIDNPLKIVIENNPCENIVVKVSCGLLTKVGDCMYNYRIQAQNNTYSVLIQFGLKTKDSVEWIDSAFYRLKRVPDPVAYAAFKYNVMHTQVSNAIHIILRMEENFDYDIAFTIKEYSVKLFRNDTTIFDYKNIGSITPSEVFDKIEEMSRVGDVIIIDNIIAIGPDNEERNIQAIRFKK